MKTDLIKQPRCLISPFLDERQRRLSLAARAKVIGYGGVSVVSGVTGVSLSSISAGYEDFDQAKQEKVSRGGTGPGQGLGPVLLALYPFLFR
jgi:hypothetical protein